MTVMDEAPFFSKEGRNDTYVVADRFHDVLDCIPTALAAENVAREMNRAFQRGQLAKLEEIRRALGIFS